MREDLSIYYTMKQLCHIFQSSRGKIYGMIDRGELPQPAKYGGENYWPKKEINTLLERTMANRGI